MKTILCYGDSNTWGAVPMTDRNNVGRYGMDTRWAGVMRSELGPDFWVVEEGLNARTTAFDDPIEGIHKNGRRHLLACLESHSPLDLVIIMLGTNDLKSRFSLSSFDIASAAGTLVDDIALLKKRQQPTPPKVLLVSPAPLGRLELLADMFEGGTEKSRHLARHYHAVAADRGVDFFDAGSVVKSSDVDGIHLDADQQQALGLAIAAKVRTCLS